MPDTSQFGNLGEWMKRSQRGSATQSPVSITSDQPKTLKRLLAALSVLSVAVSCIENGLSAVTLLTLPFIALALLRDDYSRPWRWSENTVTRLLVVYLVLVTTVLFIVFRSLYPPHYMVYFTYGTLISRSITPLTDRNVAQLLLLTFGMILVNCLLTNHLIFGISLPVYLFMLMAALVLFHTARHGWVPYQGTRDAIRFGKAPTGLKEGPTDSPHPERVETGTPHVPPAQESWWQFGRARNDVTHLTSISNGLVEQPLFGKKLRRLSFSLFQWAFVVLLLTIVGFVLIPRPFIVLPGLRAANTPGGGAELAQKISYRDMVDMAGRQRVAFTVDLWWGKLPDFPYWRGRVLDKTDGRTWSPSDETPEVRRFVEPTLPHFCHYRFYPHKLLSKIVYTAGIPNYVVGRDNKPLQISSKGEVFIDSPYVADESYGVDAWKRLMPVLPRQAVTCKDTTGVTPRIEQLATQWIQGITLPKARAQAIVSQLERNYRYSLETPPPPEGTHPIEYFLFEVRAGHCEYYAGALCLLLRSVGIPARVVEGFAGVEPGPERNQFIVRFAQAHAWVEAVVGDDGWTIFDPIPPSVGQGTATAFWHRFVDLYDYVDRRWTKYVAHYDFTDQKRIMETLSQLVGGDIGLGAVLSPIMKVFLVSVVIVVCGIVTARVATRPTKSRKDNLSTVYTTTMKALAKAGVLTRVHSWHERNTAEILEKVPECRDVLRKFMDAYFRGRFRQDAGSATRDELAPLGRELLQKIAEHTARRREA